MSDTSMLTSYLVSSEHDPLTELFLQEENGKLAFGLYGESKECVTPHDVLVREIQIRDYVMEGFITYFVKAERSDKGLLISIRKTGSNRDQHLDWAIERYIENQGFSAKRT
jgi:hypothetical protein